MAIRRILVPVELNSDAHVALDLAAKLALPLSASVDVLHVWDRPLRLVANRQLDASSWFGGPAASELQEPLEYDEDRNAAARCLDDLVRRAIPRPVPPTRCLLERGAPADVILAYSARGDYELVVMATRGRNGLAHLLLGSVAERVVRCAPVPVVTIRPPRCRAGVEAA